MKYRPAKRTHVSLVVIKREKNILFNLFSENLLDHKTEFKTFIEKVNQMRLQSLIMIIFQKKMY